MRFLQAALLIGLTASAALVAYSWDERSTPEEPTAPRARLDPPAAVEDFFLVRAPPNGSLLDRTWFELNVTQEMRGDVPRVSRPPAYFDALLPQTDRFLRDAGAFLNLSIEDDPRVSVTSARRDFALAEIAASNVSFEDCSRWYLSWTLEERMRDLVSGAPPEADPLLVARARELVGGYSHYMRQSSERGYTERDAFRACAEGLQWRGYMMQVELLATTQAASPAPRRYPAFPDTPWAFPEGYPRDFVIDFERDRNATAYCAAAGWDDCVTFGFTRRKLWALRAAAWITVGNSSELDPSDLLENLTPEARETRAADFATMFLYLEGEHGPSRRLILAVLLTAPQAAEMNRACFVEFDVVRCGELLRD